MIPVIYKKRPLFGVGRVVKAFETAAPAREWKEYVTFEHSVERWYAGS